MLGRLFGKGMLVTAILLMIAGMANTTDAQTVSGSVRGLGNDTVAKATILMRSLAGKYERYGESNDLGNFSLALGLPGRYVLNIRFIGYRPYIDTLDIRADLDLGTILLRAIDSARGQLRSVTVESSRRIVTHLLDREVIQVENTYLGRLPNIRELLNQIPEVRFDDADNISVLGRSNVAIFINGVLSNVPFKNIPIQNIARVEVITNPSSKYEGNIEAVINVILKRGINDGIQANFSVQYENKTLNNYSGTGNISFNKGPFNSVLNFTYGKGYYMNNTTSQEVFLVNDPAYSLNTYSNQRSQGHYYYLDWNATAKIGKNNLLTLNATWQPGHTPSSRIESNDIFTTGKSAAVDSGTASNVLWSYYTRFGDGGIAFSNKTGHLTSEARFDLYYQDDGTRTYNDFYLNNMKSISNDSFLSVNTDQYRRSNALVPSLNFQYEIGRQRLEFGAKYYHINSDFFLNFSDSGYFSPVPRNNYTSAENISASYVNYIFKLKRWDGQLGVRGEYSTLGGDFNELHISNNLFKLLPSAQLSYQIGKSDKLILSYSEKINRVPFSRLTPLFYYVNPFLAYQGNPLLQPQILNSVQLKYVFKTYYISAYYNDYHNALGQLPFYEGNSTILRFSNYQKVNYGAILDVPVQVTKWWYSKYNIRLYYQRQDGYIDTAYFSTHSWVTTFAANENFKLDKTYSLDLSLSYTVPYYSSVNRISRGPDLEFNLARTVPQDHLEFILHFSDILNTYSWTDTKRDFQGVDFNSTLYRPERGISITMKYNFSNGRKTTAAKANSDDINSRW